MGVLWDPVGLHPKAVSFKMMTLGKQEPKVLHVLRALLGENSVVLWCQAAGVHMSGTLVDGALKQYILPVTRSYVAPVAVQR